MIQNFELLKQFYSMKSEPKLYEISVEIVQTTPKYFQIAKFIVGVIKIGAIFFS